MAPATRAETSPPRRPGVEPCGWDSSNWTVPGLASGSPAGAAGWRSRVGASRSDPMSRVRRFPFRLATGTGLRGMYWNSWSWYVWLDADPPPAPEPRTRT
ncbi:MAG: hypothetical protein LIQ31_12555 [Planctomycetes bacterium]|nr:hypothetical protein [Planctomycetota bacterium]